MDIPNNIFAGNNNSEMSVNFLYSSVGRYFQDISELITEWYSLQSEPISTFMAQTGLDKYFSESDFINLATAQAYLPTHFIPLFHKMQPFNITIENVYKLNNRIYVKCKNQVNIDLATVSSALLQNAVQKQEKLKQRRHELYVQDLDESRRKKRILNTRYRERHRAEINERNKQRYHADIEKTHKKDAQYRQKNRDKLNMQKRARYHADIEKTHARDAAYRAANRDRINARKRQHYQENIEQIHEQSAQYHAANRDSINARKRDYYRRTIEQQHSYSAKYRAEHRDEINARSRQAYRQNLEEQRKKNAEKTRRYVERHRERIIQQRSSPEYLALRRKRAAIKRFKTKTGPIILSALEQLLKSKQR